MLRDHVNIIGKASQPFKRDKNNVIIAEGTTEL